MICLGLLYFIELFWGSNNEWLDCNAISLLFWSWLFWTSGAWTDHVYLAANSPQSQWIVKQSNELKHREWLWIVLFKLLASSSTSVVYPQIDQKWCIWSSSHSAESDLFSNLGPISMVSKDWKEPRKGKATTRTHVYFASGWGRQWVWRWEGERRCWNPSTLLIYSTSICMTTLRTLMIVSK